VEQANRIREGKACVGAEGNAFASRQPAVSRGSRAHNGEQQTVFQ
jgi:hypothetical protein